MSGIFCFYKERTGEGCRIRCGGWGGGYRGGGGGVGGGGGRRGRDWTRKAEGLRGGGLMAGGQQAQVDDLGLQAGNHLLMQLLALQTGVGGV